MKYLFIAFLFFSSCKDAKKHIPPEDKSQKPITTIEPEINLKNQIFHLKIDGRDKPEKYVNVLGQYVIDRFENPKKAVFLDGISDLIEIKNHKNINPEKAITIAIWYQPDSYKGNGSNAIIWKGIGKYENPYGQYFFNAIGDLYPVKSATFKFGLSINGKLNQLQSKSNIWKPNQWHLLVGTFDGNNMKFFVNGKLVNQRSIKGKLDIYDTSLLLGKTPDKEFYTSGIYDDFRLFDRALNIEEINLLAQEK